MESIAGAYSINDFDLAINKRLISFRPAFQVCCCFGQRIAEDVGCMPRR